MGFDCQKNIILDGYYYRPQRSCEGYVFTPVCLSTGGVPGQVPPRTRYTPQDQEHPPDQVHPPGTRYPPGPGTPPTPWDQVHPLGPGVPPRTRYTSQDQVHPPGTRYTLPPGTRYTPPGPGTSQSWTRYTHPWDQVHPPSRRLLLRTVRILLECILVVSCRHTM